MIGQDSKLVLTDEEMENLTEVWGKGIMETIFKIYAQNLSAEKITKERYIGKQWFPNYQRIETPDSNVTEWIIEGVDYEY